MDTAQWPQDVGLVKPMENQMVSNASNPNMNSGGANNTAMLEQQRRARPHKEQAINCPRCNSTNTKFCYYNNYSLTQPRYFCKTCRRYWTEGGSLRNVPVGGGSRKNRRSSSSSSSITSSVSVTKKLPDITQPPMINMSSAKSVSHQNPKIHEGQDLNLAFSTSTDHHYHTMSEFAHELPNMDQTNNSNHIPTSSTTTTTHLSALEFLRNGINSKGYGSFMPMAPSSVQDTDTVYSSPSGGFTLQDYKPTTLNFGVDGYGSIQQGVHHQENSGRPLFPFEDLRQVSNTSEFDHHQNNRGAQGDSNGYWSGMLGGGSW